jgi:hypothetical protein
MAFKFTVVCKVCGEAYVVGENTTHTLAVMRLHIKSRHASEQDPPNGFFDVLTKPE